MALESLNRRVEISNKEEIIKISGEIKIEMNEKQEVFLNGVDVTKQIRSKEVSSIVSQISSIKEVRLNMVSLQRKMAEGKDVIMEGRDITTYVFPNADLKIYLDANLEVRAKRRYLENKEKGIDTSYEEVLENIKLRDENDKHKEIGSLMVAKDAVIIDTSNLSIEEAVEKVEKLIIEKRGK